MLTSLGWRKLIGGALVIGGLLVAGGYMAGATWATMAVQLIGMALGIGATP